MKRQTPPAQIMIWVFIKTNSDSGIFFWATPPIFFFVDSKTNNARFPWVAHRWRSCKFDFNDILKDTKAKYIILYIYYVSIIMYLIYDIY